MRRNAHPARAGLAVRAMGGVDALDAIAVVAVGAPFLRARRPLHLGNAERRAGHADVVRALLHVVEVVVCVILALNAAMAIAGEHLAVAGRLTVSQWLPLLGELHAALAAVA